VSELSVTEVGGSGPYVVFLHGLFGQGKNFQSIARGLEPDFRSLLVDLPNHGASPWTESVDYAAMADDVAAAVRSHLGTSGGGRVPADHGAPGIPADDGAPGIPADDGALPPAGDGTGPERGQARVHVVGHSMGGKVAMQLALRHPELVDHLVVVDIAPAAGNGTGEFEHLLGALATLDLARLESRSQADAELTELIGSPTVRGFLLQNLQRADGGWRWRANLDLLRASLEVIGGFPDPAPGASFDGPVLWVAGARSDYVRPEHGERMRALFGRTRQLTVKDAGHWVHSEQPEVFTQALRVFLASEG